MSLRAVAIGEVLWDLLPSGRQLGGAPANFACQARALGAEAQLITRVGNDDLGHEIRQQLQVRGLASTTLQVDEAAPTGTVAVSLAADGQPRFTITDNVAWDRLEANAEALAAVASADAVCFGSLGQRSDSARRAIHALLDATRPGALRIFDVNLRPPFYAQAIIEGSLARANVLKLNDQELPVLADFFGLRGDVREQVASLAERHRLRLVVLTRGAQGSVLHADGRWSEHPGLSVVVRDAVGAGDAFTATVVLGWLSRRDLDEINQRANEVAAYVCTQPGATPSLPDELRRRAGAPVS